MSGVHHNYDKCDCHLLKNDRFRGESGKNRTAGPLNWILSVSIGHRETNIYLVRTVK